MSVVFLSRLSKNKKTKILHSSMEPSLPLYWIYIYIFFFAKSELKWRSCPNLLFWFLREEFMGKIEILRHYILSKTFSVELAIWSTSMKILSSLKKYVFSISIKAHSTFPYSYNFSLILPWLSASFYPHIYIFPWRYMLSSTKFFLLPLLLRSTFLLKMEYP